MSEISAKDRSGYRNSFGSTLLFSGVQLYQIIIKIVRSKFVAMLIGPEGMGISSLLHSTTDLVSSATNFGLSTSSVKSLSAAYSQGNQQKIAITIIVLRRLIFLTALLGMLVCACLAPVWSQQSFGNDEYILAFVFVSVVVLAEQLYKGEIALLQGLRKKKSLAKANVVSQTVSLFVTIPLYYFYGLKAIVWVLVLFSLLTYVISKCYTKSIKIEKVYVTWKQTFSLGTEMIKLGFFLSLQILLSHGVLYLVKNYVSQTGGIEEVGLYSAGTSIVNVYLGLVFSAIATSYFPQLAGTKTNEEMCDAVKKQAEISILLFAPIIVAFIVFAKPAIIFLYSEKFLPIEGLLYWAIAATLIKAMGWALSYTLLAKAKPSTFFLNEFFAKFYTFPLAILGYKYMGLTGFGIAILVGYSIYLIQELLVVKRLFNITYTFSIWRLFLLLHLPVLVAFLIMLLTSTIIAYLLGSVLFCLTIVYVIYELDTRMALLSALKKRIKKHNI